MKKMVITGLVSLSALGMAMPALAASTGNSDGTGATSNAHVKLTPADETTDPTDPTDPGDGGGETGNKGPLTIDYVTPLEFGEQKLTGTEAVYQTTSKLPNVQISDKRGQGQGWTLKVKSSEFVDSTNQTQTLKGATVTLPVGTIKSVEGNVSTAPTANEAILESDNASEHVLMTAAATAGLGTWEDLFDASKVQITVPSGNLVGDYSSSLTWTLEDAPQP